MLPGVLRFDSDVQTGKECVLITTKGKFNFYLIFFKIGEAICVGVS